MKAAVITVSDRASRGEYEDRSGPEIEKILAAAFPGITLTRTVVPDEAAPIRDAFNEHSDADFIFTTGGTGLSPKDITPEVTEDYCDRSLPGIAEMLRAESYKETANALLSRGYAGVKASTIIVNFPGSVKAVRLCTDMLVPVMEHAMEMLAGKGHA